MSGWATWRVLACSGAAWAVVLCIGGLGACGPTVSEQDVAEALDLLDRLEHRVRRQDHQGALALFTNAVQERIRHVGGGPTPLAGFFTGLMPKFEKRNRHRLSRGTIWITYTYDGDQEMHVALARFSEGWLITRMVDVDWGV